MGVGILIVLGYSLYSYIRLSEVAVGIAFGPLLFLGTYYVMTGQISVEPLILSLPSMLFTINLIYTDTFLDKELDKNENKKTLVNIFSSENRALLFQKILITSGYITVFLLPIFDIADWEVLFVYLTIPLSVDLIHSMKMYVQDKEAIPEKKWYHFPFEDWEDVAENRSQAFMFRMYQARNIMIYVSVIISGCLFMFF